MRTQGGDHRATGGRHGDREIADRLPATEHADCKQRAAGREHDRVELAVPGAHEYGIRRVWPDGVESPALRLLHRRADDLDLLATEIPVVARMRIERCNRDAGLLMACAP